jgi:lysophospholipase L1-like esterase
MNKKLLFPLLLLTVLGCVPGASHPTPTKPATPIRFLALGDSYTSGAGVPENERWPNQLANKLRGNGYQVDLTIIAQTGWTTYQLSEGIRTANPQGTYDLVSLLIGVNNQGLGRKIENYRSQFQALLEQAIVFAGGDAGRVMVFSLPDWSITPFAKGWDIAKVAAEVNEYNAINRAASDQAGAHYIDLAPVFGQAAADPSLLGPDGFHPTGEMYTLWVEAAYPVVLDALQN